MLTTDRLLS